MTVKYLLNEIKEKYTRRWSNYGLTYEDVEWLIGKVDELEIAKHKLKRREEITNDRIKRIQNQRTEINRLREENKKLKQQLQLNKDIDEFYQLDDTVNVPKHYQLKNDKFRMVGESIGMLVDKKNKAYGDSFNKGDEFLKLLYPDGVNPSQYKDLLYLIRVFDKQMRIATDKDALGENPAKDIAGYSILKVGYDDES